MASRRQIAANRRNARKSTGPRTSAGKLRSRSNALKHGLTAETVITVFENPKHYQAFERIMVRDYKPLSAIEHQLAARLSSLLWRLRRAAAIETGLFQIQGSIITERRGQRLRREDDDRKTKINLYSVMGILPKQISVNQRSDFHPSQPFPFHATAEQKNKETETDTKIASVTLRNNSRTVHRRNGGPETLAQCFMRVARLDDQILDRVTRYEAALWKQAVQLVQILAKSKAKQFRNRVPKKGY